MQTKNILRVRFSLLEQSVTNQLFCGVAQASGEGLASSRSSPLPSAHGWILSSI
jgi:hypothetical protein